MRSQFQMFAVLSWAMVALTNLLFLAAIAAQWLQWVQAHQVTPPLLPP